MNYPLLYSCASKPRQPQLPDIAKEECYPTWQIPQCRSEMVGASLKTVFEGR